MQDRWQVPAALIAAAVTAAAFYRLQPPPVADQFDTLMADVRLLSGAQRYLDAADAAKNLLAMDPPLPDGQRAELHDFLADLIYTVELEEKRHGRKNVDELLANQERALELGLPETAERLARRGISPGLARRFGGRVV